MEKNRIYIIVYILILIGSISCIEQPSRFVDIDHQLPGYCFAQSSITDTLAPGGYGTSENKVLESKPEHAFVETTVSMNIDLTSHNKFISKKDGNSFVFL